MPSLDAAKRAVGTRIRRRRVTPARYRKRYALSGRKWMLDVLYAEQMEGEAHWMGVRSLKNPLDAWVYQEIIWETKPEVIVELGSRFGGSTLFLAQLLDIIGEDGRV